MTATGNELCGALEKKGGMNHYQVPSFIIAGIIGIDSHK
jgi:hypothetical protein